MNEGRLVDPASDADDVVTTYEDKDGDWMLVGDVPWEYVLRSSVPSSAFVFTDPWLGLQCLVCRLADFLVPAGCLSTHASV
jgi:hypothetical protein